jgi:hypothetical protein
MKVNAWDCLLNLDAILLKDMGSREIVTSQGSVTMVKLQDEPYTSFCDFSGSCAYQCAAAGAIRPDQYGTDNSTAQVYDFQRQFLERQQRLIEYFQTETAMPVRTVQAMFYEDIPDSFALVGLRDVLNKVRIRRHDGLYGTLKLVNEYIVFQPDKVTDPQIPVALRYGRAYGRMPRTFDLVRDSLFSVGPPIEETLPPALPAINTAIPASVAEPIPEAESPAPAAVDTEDSRLLAKALESFAEWTQILQLYLTQDTGPVTQPAGWPDLTGWRWVFHYFRSPEIVESDTKPIAYRWFMDNFWTSQQQTLVFGDWLRQGISNLSVEEQIAAATYMIPGRIELFEGRLGGCAVYNRDVKKVQTYCYYQNIFSQCTTLFEPEVQTIMGPPVNRKTDTGPFFGFLTSKQGAIVFKTVDKVKGDMKGAECSNTSNLQGHEKRIKEIQALLKESDLPIVSLLLNDNTAEQDDDKTIKQRQDALKRQFLTAGAAFSVDLEHTADLSLKQICPYMEFLLRYADRHSVERKRWFLSVVDSARAGVKMT